VKENVVVKSMLEFFFKSKKRSQRIVQTSWEFSFV